MRSLPFSALVLLLLCIALGGLFVFAADPLLYSVEKEPAASAFHANPDILGQRAVNSTDDLLPLMQDIIDGQGPVVADIRLRDFDAAQRDLAVLANRWSSLAYQVTALDIGGGEVGVFLNATMSQETSLSELVNQSLAFDAVQKVAGRDENRNHRELQASVASQGAELKEAIRTIYARYSTDHGIVADTGTKLGLDTRRYTATLAETGILAGEIEASELPLPDPAFLQESGISFYVEPGQAGYREPLRVFGVVSPPGMKRVVSLLLDDSRVATIDTDLKGNYFTTYTVERVPAGTHSLAAVTGTLTSEHLPLEVTETATVTSLIAEPVIINRSESGAVCNGSVLANRPVRNAPVRILIDGENPVDVITAGDGTFSAVLQIPPGSRTLRAEFSADGYPLLPSTSEGVTVEVPPRPFQIPGTSPGEPLPAYMVVAFVLVCAGGAAAWFILRGRSAPSGIEPEPAEAARIRTELEEMISEAMKELPPAGSEREAALKTAINTQLERYAACLGEHGLSEAARQAYLTLAGRIAASLGVPAYRSLTPREMSATCRSETYGHTFDLFVGIYERIRYAGSESELDKKGFFNRFVGIYENIRSVSGGKREKDKETTKED